MPTPGYGFWSSILRYLCSHKKFLFRSFWWRHCMWFAVWATPNQKSWLCLWYYPLYHYFESQKINKEARAPYPSDKVTHKRMVSRWSPFSTWRLNKTTNVCEITATLGNRTKTEQYFVEPLHDPLTLSKTRYCNRCVLKTMLWVIW